LPVAPAPVRGLRELQPYVQWGYPKVAAEILALIFTVSQTIAKKEPREALFYLKFEDARIDWVCETCQVSNRSMPGERCWFCKQADPVATAPGSDLALPDGRASATVCEGHLLCVNGWHLLFPEQRGTEHHVEPLQRGPGTAEAEALIEVHSHHAMEAKFSDEDDVDEGGGMSFRVYGVIGTIFLSPAIRARVGLFGHLYEYPASEFFELPEGVIDCVQEI
jgi:hypothetical protein